MLVKNYMRPYWLLLLISIYNMVSLSPHACAQTLKVTLEGRADLLKEIASAADFLRPEDGKKANGTSDVDSR